MKAILADDPRWVIDDLPFEDDSIVTEPSAQAASVPTPVTTTAPPVAVPPPSSMVTPSVAPSVARSPFSDLMQMAPEDDINKLDAKALDSMLDDEAPTHYFDRLRDETYEWMDVSAPDEWFGTDEESAAEVLKHWAGGSPWLGLRWLVNSAGLTTEDGEKLQNAIQEFGTLPNKYKHSKEGAQYLTELEQRFKHIVDPEDVEFKEMADLVAEAIINAPLETGAAFAKAMVADPLFFAAMFIPLLKAGTTDRLAVKLAEVSANGVVAQRIIKTTAGLSAFAAQEAMIGAAYQAGVNLSHGTPVEHNVANMAGLSAAGGVLLLGAGRTAGWLKAGGKFEDQVAHIEGLQKSMQDGQWASADAEELVTTLKTHIDKGLDPAKAVKATREEMDNKHGKSDGASRPVLNFSKDGIETLLKGKAGDIFEAPDFMPGWKIEIGKTTGRAGDLIEYNRTNKVLKVDVDRAVKDFFESKRKLVNPNKDTAFGKSVDDALERMNLNRQSLNDHLKDPADLLKFVLEKEKRYALRKKPTSASLKKGTKASTSQVRGLRNTERHINSIDYALKRVGYKQADMDSKAARTFDLKKEIGKAHLQEGLAKAGEIADRAVPFVKKVAERAVTKGKEAFNKTEDGSTLRTPPKDKDGLDRVTRDADGNIRFADDPIDFSELMVRTGSAIKAGVKSAARDIGRVPGVGGVKGKAYQKAFKRNQREVFKREKTKNSGSHIPVTREQSASVNKEAHRRARAEQPNLVGSVYRGAAKVFKVYKTVKSAAMGMNNFIRNPSKLMNEARKTTRYRLGHDEGSRFVDYTKEHIGMIAVMERHIRASIDTVMEQFPTPDSRKAVAHYIEGNLDEFNAMQIAKGLPAIKFTSKDLIAIKQVENMLSEVYRWIRKQPGGRNVKFRKNYVPHLYNDHLGTSFEDYLSQILGAPKKALATKSTHYYSREFDTMMDAMEAGYTPLEDIGGLLSGYLRGIFRVEANKMLIDRVRNIVDNNDVPMITRRDDAPDHYAVIKHASFRDKNGDYYYAHSDIAPTLKMLFDTRDAGVTQRLLLNLTYLVKRSVLAFSMFHGVALLESALYAGLNPTKMGREYKGALNQLKEGELGDLIDLGLMNGLQIGWIDDIKGDALYNAMSAAEGLISQIPYVGKVASQLPKGVRVFHENLDKILWDKIATGGKLIAFTKNLDELIRINAKMAEKGGVPLRSLDELAAEAAMFTNDAFGGLNWARMASNVQNNILHKIGAGAASPSGRRAMQMMVFAPDWSLANIRIQAKAFPGLNSKKDVRRLYQYYMARGAVMFALFAEALQQSSGEGSVFDNAFPLGWMRPKLGPNTRIEWSKQLAEVPREMYYVMSGDPLHSAYWKSAFLPRAVADLSKGQSVKEAVLDKVVPITLSNLAKPPHWQAIAGALSKPIYIKD